jgi:hypothetical protein
MMRTKLGIELIINIILVLLLSLSAMLPANALVSESGEVMGDMGITPTETIAGDKGYIVFDFKNLESYPNNYKIVLYDNNSSVVAIKEYSSIGIGEIIVDHQPFIVPSDDFEGRIVLYKEGNGNWSPLLERNDRMYSHIYHSLVEPAPTSIDVVPQNSVLETNSTSSSCSVSGNDPSYSLTLPNGQWVGLSGKIYYTVFEPTLSRDQWMDLGDSGYKVRFWDSTDLIFGSYISWDSDTQSWFGFIYVQLQTPDGTLYDTYKAVKPSIADGSTTLPVEDPNPDFVTFFTSKGEVKVYVKKVWGGTNAGGGTWNKLTQIDVRVEIPPRDASEHQIRFWDPTGTAFGSYMSWNSYWYGYIYTQMKWPSPGGTIHEANIDPIVYQSEYFPVVDSSPEYAQYADGIKVYLNEVTSASQSSPGSHTYNKITQIKVTVDVPGPVVPDGWEPDNDWTQANTITPGVQQIHNILNGGTDVDWMKFILTSASDVTIETSGPSGDTEMWLFNSVGVPNSWMTYCDDKVIGNKFSQIIMTNLPAGTYYIKVDETGQNQEIPTYYIDLTATVTPFPDLVVEGISYSPTSPQSGDTVTFTVNVKNQGTISADPSYVYYYIDESYVGQDSIPTLSPNSTSTQTFSYTFTTTGAHTFKAKADASGIISEGDETNNEKSATMSVGGLPDLVVSGITFLPDQPQTGAATTFTVNVKNQGNEIASNFYVYYYVDGANVGSTYIPSLSPGSTSAPTFSYTFTNADTYTFKAKADATYTVSESDETNNEKSMSVDVIEVHETNFVVNRDGYQFALYAILPHIPTLEVFLKTYPISNLVYTYSGVPYLTQRAKFFYETLYPWIFASGAGECVGMSSSTLHFFTHLGQESPQDYSDSGTYTYDLSLYNQRQDGQTVLDLIDIYHGKQLTKEFKIKYAFASYDPTTVYDQIHQAVTSGTYNTNPGLIYITKPEPLSAGHMLVPYKIVEKSSTLKEVYVYDPNYPFSSNIPCISSRSKVVFSLDSNTFSHSSEQCDGTPYIPYDYSSANEWHIRFMLFQDIATAGITLFDKLVLVPSSSVNVTITDQYGRSIGFKNGALVNEIPEAMYLSELIAPGAGLPLPFRQYYHIPDELTYTVTLKGNYTGVYDVIIFSTDSLYYLSNVTSTPTTSDILQISPDGNEVTFTTNEEKKDYSITIYRELNNTTRTYSIANTSLSTDEMMTVKINNDNNSIELINRNTTKTYNLQLSVLGNNLSSLFQATNIYVDANDTHNFTVINWTRLDSVPVDFSLDKGSDGTVDASHPLSNNTTGVGKYLFITSLSDGSTEKNLTFTEPGNQTVYLKIPKNANVVGAAMDLQGCGIGAGAPICSKWVQTDWSGGSVPGIVTDVSHGWNKFNDSANIDYAGSYGNLLLVKQTATTYFTSGNLTSSIFDAGSIVDWENISWSATIPENTNLTFQTRISNDSVSWSDWLPSKIIINPQIRLYNCGDRFACETTVAPIDEIYTKSRIKEDIIRSLRYELVGTPVTNFCQPSCTDYTVTAHIKVYRTDGTVFIDGNFTQVTQGGSMIPVFIGTVDGLDIEWYGGQYGKDPTGSYVDLIYSRTTGLSDYPSGSEILSSSSRYIQYKVFLSTLNLAVTPILHDVTLTYKGISQYPTNPTLDVADSGLPYEWYYTGELKTTNRTSDFSNETNKYLQICTPDNENKCLVPLAFHSDSAGMIRIKNILVSILDFVPPSVTINTPVGLYDTSFEINVSATDDVSGVDAVYFRWENSTDVGEWQLMTRKEETNYWTASFDISYIEGGNYTLRINATDLIGNSNTTMNISIGLIKFTPTITNQSVGQQPISLYDDTVAWRDAYYNISSGVARLNPLKQTYVTYPSMWKNTIAAGRNLIGWYDIESEMSSSQGLPEDFGYVTGIYENVILASPTFNPFRNPIIPASSNTSASTPTLIYGTVEPSTDGSARVSAPNAGFAVAYHTNDIDNIADSRETTSQTYNDYFLYDAGSLWSNWSSGDDIVVVIEVNNTETNGNGNYTASTNKIKTLDSPDVFPDATLEKIPTPQLRFIGPNYISLAWVGLNDTNGNVVGYSVYRSVDGVEFTYIGDATHISGGSVHYDDANTLNESYYRIGIRYGGGYETEGKSDVLRCSGGACAVLLNSASQTPPIFASSSEPKSESLPTEGSILNDIARPMNMRITLAGNDIALDWDDVPGAVYYRVFTTSDRFDWNFSSYIETNTSDFTHYGAASNSSTYYYLVRVVDVNGNESTNSKMLVKRTKTFTYNPSKTNVNWISLPYDSAYKKASDIVATIEPSGTNTKISGIAKWDAKTQSSIGYGYVGGPGWLGTNFDIYPGDGIYISLSGNTGSFDWTIVGADLATTLHFTYNPSKTNVNWISMPYTGVYKKASDIVSALEPSGTNRKISGVAKWDTRTQTSMGYGYVAGPGWIGTDFDIYPGDGVYISLSGNTYSFDWTPELIIPESVVVPDEIPLRYFDISTHTLTDTPIKGTYKSPAIFGDTIVFQKNGNLTYYNISTGIITDTGINAISNYFSNSRTIWGDKIAFTADEVSAGVDYDGDGTLNSQVVGYYNITSKTATFVGKGVAQGIYKSKIVFNSPFGEDYEIKVYNTTTGRTSDTGVRGIYSAIHENTIAFVTLEMWWNKDFTGDGAMDDWVLGYIKLIDSDKDGLLDIDDACPYSTPGIAIDRYGCEITPESIVSAINATQAPNTSITVVDANGDGIIEKNETFNITLTLETGEHLNISNIAHSSIDTSIPLPKLTYYNESDIVGTPAEQQIKSITGMPEVSNASLIDINVTKLALYLGTQEFAITVDVPTEFTGTIENATLATNAFLGYCDGSYDAAIGCSGSLVPINMSCISIETPQICYRAIELNEAPTPDIARIENIPHFSSLVSIIGYPDITPPVTVDNYEYNGIWTNMSTNITLTATDPYAPPAVTSGVAWTRYCTKVDCDPSKGSDYIEPITITTEAITYVRYTSMDRAGNLEATKQVIVRIDKTPPKLGISIKPSPSNGLTTITVTSNERLPSPPTVVITKPEGSQTTVEMREVGDDAWAGNYTVDATGTHRVYISGADQAGNIGELNAKFMGDVTPPVTVDDYGYNDTWTNASASIILTATDSYSGVAWTKYCMKVDCEPLKGDIYSAPITITTEGITYVRYASMDRAGNLETAKRIVVKIDKTPPKLSVSIKPAPSNGLTMINVTSNEGLRSPPAVLIASPEGVQTAIDMKEAGDNTWSGGYTVNTTGTHRLYITGSDRAGNVGELWAKFMGDVDPPIVGAPNLSVSSPTNITTNITVSSGVSSLSISETRIAGCTLVVAEPSGSTSEYVMSLTYRGYITEANATAVVNLNGDGNYNLTVLCYDDAGNSGYNFTPLIVDTTPPQIAITSPRDGARVNLTVTINATVIDELSPPAEIISVLIDGEEVAVTLPYEWDTIRYAGGEYTITVKARDQAGNVGSESITVTVASPLWLKKDAISKLEAAKTGAKKIDKEIDAIIKHINNSLADKKGSLFVDDWHLVTEPMLRGLKVFHEERKATTSMIDDLCRPGTVLGSVNKTFANVTLALVDADRLLVKTAIEDANNTTIKDPKYKKIVGHLIETAEKKYENALKLLNKTDKCAWKYKDDAIREFGKAWVYVQLAIKFTNKEPIPDPDGYAERFSRVLDTDEEIEL